MEAHRLPLSLCHAECFFANFGAYSRVRPRYKGALLRQESAQGFGRAPHPNSLRRVPQRRERHTNS
jgi:hypothetical protein